ncbi:unnamed protein product [Rotaria sordida]|uniref:PiggyBac transposable element-derived protein domain-containing protein n=1 Tax=Rotaria sordida TaxID=392033 RepID=A0A820BW77_9BILA|nr:unnamed protein product [Rotaria sordida]
MNRLINSMTKANLAEFEENSSENLSEMEIHGLEGDESDSRNDKDDEGDGGGSGSDEDDSEDYKCDNRAVLQSSLVYNCPWTTNFCHPPVQEFQKSRKCFGVLPSSPTQTIKSLFCDKAFNLILEQTNIYGRQKYARAGDVSCWVDITESQLKKFIGINIIMRYCRNPSIDS